MEEKKERQLAKLVVYVFLERNGKHGKEILLGRRKNAFGEGHYSLPAGHIEKGETVLECAKRELFEETGIKVKSDEFEFVGVRLIEPYMLNGVMADLYVAFAVKPKNWEGEPKLMEPEKNEVWEWHSIDKLPEPMFPPVPMLIELIKKSVNFID